MLVNRANLETLFVNFNAAYMRGFEQAGTDEWMRLAMEVTSTTRQEEYGFLGQAHDLMPFEGERVLRGLATHGYTLRNETYESTIEVGKDDIADDTLGLYTRRFEVLGEAAARHPIQLVMRALRAGNENVCYDGQFFFDTDHPIGDTGRTQSNWSGGGGAMWVLLCLSSVMKPLLFQRRQQYELTRMDDMDDEEVFMRRTFRYGVDGRCNAGYGMWQYAFGSRQALNEDNYRAAREAMMGYQGDRGAVMGVMPTHLLVGPGLEHEALELLNAARQADGATNVYAGTAELIVSPWFETVV